ncbi:B12-binding domain-containing radical SAM protein [Geomonas subterranea]|uniref:B12-binding domain-containing radical SAM protein n=1 Tax=Geomonas subterranea TaxID=2847989 RepID=A0ABX8LB43_9BACT|nr:B12-binding domain-containing radical SAM protein [Geomonas subterranea]QXE89223.1 B12-binding domain-containing radical SAM protein [Geomonas subterranea]QXM08665.1 B12-binding domain-containing radical SAM protein [Geomonas subterranea]
MKVLLVYPKYPDTYWSFHYAMPFIGKKAAFPPLGLLTVAAIIPDSWSMKLTDLNVELLSDDDLRWADYVFISAMTVQRESAREVLARCKALGIKTVAGGPLFSTCHDEFPEVDHLVLGEAEVTLPRFLADLDHKKPERLYLSDERPDLSRTPIPRWSLIDMRKYASMNVQYSRGCPFDCEFCDITAMFGHTPRTKTTEQVIAELETLYSRGWRGGVFFVDDNFIGDKRKLKAEVLPAMTAWMEAHRHPFFFYTEASINLADDPHLLELMVAAGFQEVFIGIETPEKDSLRETGKLQNDNRDLLASVRSIQRAGLQVQGGFIVGFDSDSPAIFDKQLRFIQDSGIVTAMVGILMVLRGTKLHSRLASEGRIINTANGNNTDTALTFEPKMSPQVLVEGYQRLVKTIYSPDYFYERIMTFLKEYQLSGPSPFSTLQWRDLKAFFRSMLFLGILGKERLHYWKVFAWTLLRKPRLLPLTITLTIYGFHFRTVSDQICPYPASEE